MQRNESVVVGEGCSLHCKQFASESMRYGAYRIEDDETLTVEQVSKFLKLHQRTIYKLVRSGIIPGRIVGNSWRFLRSEVIKFLRAKEARVGDSTSRPRKSRGTKRKPSSASVV